MEKQMSKKQEFIKGMDDGLVLFHHFILPSIIIGSIIFAVFFTP